MTLIIELIGKIIGAAFVAMVFFALKKLKEYLEAQKESIQNKDLLLLIDSFVEAAEQLFKANDPEGKKRKQYVEEHLMALGYAITEQIEAYIEASVYEINNAEL